MLVVNQGLVQEVGHLNNVKDVGQILQDQIVQQVGVQKIGEVVVIVGLNVQDLIVLIQI